MPSSSYEITSQRTEPNAHLPLHIASEARLVLALSTTVLDSAIGQRLDGFDVVATPNRPFAARPLGAHWLPHAGLSCVVAQTR
jgi:hypothetical protein